jgi:hypothetical protein
MSDDPFCCEDLRSAYDVTFLNPARGQDAWIAYGTDFDSVSAGSPEIRYWPVRFCPFCGASLPPAASFPRRNQPVPQPPRQEA